MKPHAYLGMLPGDLDHKPYAKYWNPDMGALPGHVQDAVLRGPEAAELGLTLAEADRLMAPGYLPLETGTTVLRNGQTLVAVLTHMPRVTGAMFEWWMGWHYMEAQRYKLWHPRAHLDNGTVAMRGDDPQLSDKEKYLTTHYVTEYIGEHLQHIEIDFVEPATFMTRTVDFSAENVTALVCARVSLQQAPIVIGYLIHQIRAVAGGSEMRSRFWLGKPEFKRTQPDGLANRVLGSKLLRSLTSPPSLAHAMLVHCAMEMNHLAGFLPDLYADYH
jgi:hypothetical protein